MSGYYDQRSRSPLTLPLRDSDITSLLAVIDKRWPSEGSRCARKAWQLRRKIHGPNGLFRGQG